MEQLWKSYLTEKDRNVYASAGFGGTFAGLGRKAALLVVDVTYGFTGDKPEPIEESIKKYPLSCGEKSWESIAYIRRLLQAARQKGLPIVYTYAEGDKDQSNQWKGLKVDFLSHESMLEDGKGTKIVEEIEPLPGELVLPKIKPSAFFGTPLVSYLTAHGVDTVIVTGCTTSGCVRATVIDAFSYNYKVIVPHECSFDRGEVPHAINLFDMQQKYADVLNTDQLIQCLNELK